MRPKSIFFISTMEGSPWGGSEELWTRSARRLVDRGVTVIASVRGWPQLDARILALRHDGVSVRPRSNRASLITRLNRRLFSKPNLIREVEKAIGDISPDLVLISEGGAFPPIELIEFCVVKGWPFATVMHANWDGWWPTDDMAARYRKALQQAKRCFFVSRANCILEEKQLGYSFENSEVIRNPVNLTIDAPPLWPSPDPEQELLMACVGRLHQPQKGQDLLIEALSDARWRKRNWRLALYGDGPHQGSLENLVKRANLTDRIFFEGTVPADYIWLNNHMLVMPSRYEGLPLTIVEAMLCGRPVLATNVGGNAEVIEDGVTGFVAPSASAEIIGEALERVWDRRDELQRVGELAAVRIREIMPNNPVDIFVEKLLNL